VAASSGPQDLEPALDLILQPLLVETLMAIGEGKALEDVLPADTDRVLLGAAVDRLVMIRVIEPSTEGLLGHHSLTRRGDRLLRLLDDLDACPGRKLGQCCWAGVSCGGLVLVEESSEASAPPYSVGRGGERDDVSVVRRSSETDPIALVASTGVVVLDIGLQHAVQVALSGDEDPVGAFAADGEAIQRSAMAFIRGACGAGSTASIAIEAKIASRVAVNLASRSRIRCVKRCPASSRPAARSRARWAAQAPVG
jgi:hypothetical protein